MDGRLIGDLGEVIAEEYYALKLFDKIVPQYDAIEEKGQKRNIQIKATLQSKLTFPNSHSLVPEIYLGLKLEKNGLWKEIYNGPGELIYRNMQANYQRKGKELRRANGYSSISIDKLHQWNQSIDDDSKRVQMRNPIKDDSYYI